MSDSKRCLHFRKFANIANKKRHMLTHLPEKLYSCAICGRDFATKPEIIIHTRRHTGEKPYRCQYCEMGFVDGGEMKRHIQRRHSTGGNVAAKRYASQV